MRERVACAASHERELYNLDWFGIREDLRSFLIETREGGLSHLKEGVLTRLQRFFFEAKLGVCSMGMRHHGWEESFRALLSQFLVTGRPSCLLGCLAVHLALILFVNVEPQESGLWWWDRAAAAPFSGGRRQEARRAVQAVAARPPPCGSPGVARISESGTLAPVLGFLLRSVRWSQLLDSGWPVFKILGELTARQCDGKWLACMQNCPNEVLTVLVPALEAKMRILKARTGGSLGDKELGGAAMELWASSDPDIVDALNTCGELAVALAGATTAMAQARFGHHMQAIIYLSLVEVHLRDLAQRSECAYTSMAKMPSLWLTLGFVEDKLQGNAPHGFGRQCHLHFCPDGGSPDALACRCVPLYVGGPASGEGTTGVASGMSSGAASAAGTAAWEPLGESLCMVTADPGGDRPLEANLTRLIASDPHQLTGFWSLTYHLNRLYALVHGYHFHRPELSSLLLKSWLGDGELPSRRVQWAIVRLAQRELERASCKYVVWLDSDAYIASSEPLEAVFARYGLLNATGQSEATELQRPGQAARRAFLFAPAASGFRTNISDHFMAIRNTPQAREVVRRWWHLPKRRPKLRRFRSELFLEQTVMNVLFPHYPHLVAPKLPLWHFEGFRGSFVRHVGGIKDAAFEASLRDALLARLRAPEEQPGSPWARVVSEDAVAVRLRRLLGLRA